MERSELERLAAHLLPELPAPYVALQSEGPPSNAVVANCWGCAGKWLDLSLSEWLQSNKRWQGRRPAIYIADDSIRQAPFEGDGQAEWIEHTILGIACHELAHTLEQPIGMEPATESTRSVANAIAVVSSVVDSDYSQGIVLPPFGQHGPRWVRYAIHLHYRAWASGFRFDVDSLFSGDNYQIHEPRLWQMALGEELEELFAVPLTQLPARRPPLWYCSTWANLIQRWRDDRGQLSEMADRAVARALGEIAL